MKSKDFLKGVRTAVPVAVFLTFAITMVAVLEARAAPPTCPGHPSCKDDNGGGGGSECDASVRFPAFAYEREPTRKRPVAVLLASADGCRRELILDGKRLSAAHFRDDGGGVVISIRDDNGDDRQQLFATRFDLDGSGNVQVSDEQLLLPSENDPVPEPGSSVRLGADLWGNADHTQLYLTVRRRFIAQDGRTFELDELVIYTLDANGSLAIADRDRLYLMADVDNPGDVDWSCPTVAYPQFVPTCYPANGLIWNASGTRLYTAGDVHDLGWQASMRIEIVDKNGSADPGDWSLSGPKLVLAGERGSDADYTEPFAVLARPDPAGRFHSPEPEYLAIGYYDRTGRHTAHRTGVLNGDECVDAYAAFSDGSADAGSALWRSCLADSSDGFYTDHASGRWDSPDSWLTGSLQSNKRTDIYRHYVSGSLAGVSELVLEDGDYPDPGL